MKVWALVALGGALGSMARFGLAGAVNRLLPTSFLFGTFVVNVLGCLAFGVIVAIADERYAIGSEGRAFLLIGILGGFTTFSSFSYETFALMRQGLVARAAANAIGQVVLGLASVWAGWVLIAGRR